MKNNIKYIILIIVFILLIASVCASFLFTKYSIQGVFEVNRKRFDVVFTNVLLNNDNVKVKLNNENKTIHIDTNDLDTVQIDLDIKNIGNIDSIIKNYSYSNVMSDGNIDDVVVKLSIQNSEVIKKGESKKLTIYIKNNSKNKLSYYNFNVNFLIEEYNL